MDGEFPGIVTYQSGFPIRVQTQNDTELQSSFDFEDGQYAASDWSPFDVLNPKTNAGRWLGSRTSTNISRHQLVRPLGGSATCLTHFVAVRRSATRISCYREENTHQRAVEHGIPG